MISGVIYIQEWVKLEIERNIDLSWFAGEMVLMVKTKANECLPELENIRDHS